MGYLFHGSIGIYITIHWERLNQNPTGKSVNWKPSFLETTRLLNIAHFLHVSKGCAIFLMFAHHRRFFSLDASAFDSTIPADVYYKVITRLRGQGFSQHVIADRIKKTLEASYTSTQIGYLFDLLSGNIFHEQRGGATGKKGTTSDNSIALVALVLGTSQQVAPNREDRIDSRVRARRLDGPFADVVFSYFLCM